MASFSDRSAQSPAGSALGGYLLSLIVVSLLATGCGRRPQASPNIPPPLPNTPDGKLEGVMRRFKAALEDAHSAAGSGVKSMRTASLRKFEPTGEDPAPKAEVTVTTTVAVDRTPTEDNPDEQVQQAAEDAKTDAKKGGEKQPPGTIAPVIQSESFDLTYDGNYWKIAAQPKDEIIRLCIDETLKEQ